MEDVKFSGFANGGTLQPTDTLVGLRAGVNTKFTGIDPNNFIWVSADASPGGNGSISSPYTTISAAYAAGVTSASPFVVAVIPGTYNESATPLALVPYGSIYAFDSETTSIKFGALTFDQTAWALGLSTTGRIGFYNFAMSAVSLKLAVPSGSDGTFIMQNIVGSTIAAEKWVFQNLTTLSDLQNCDFTSVNINSYGSFIRCPGTVFGSVTASTYDPDLGTPIGNGRFEISERITQLFVKANSGNTQNVYLNSPEATALSSFFVEGDTINIFKTANVQDPTITSGTPTITNVDSAANIYAAYPSPTNYTPLSTNVLGHLQGINAALASVSFSPNSIFWVSTTASPAGDGSVAKPFTTVSSAYAAGIASSAPFLVGLFPGAYFEPSTVLELVADSGFIGLSSQNTSLVLGATTLDQTSWTTSGNIATLTLQGLTFSTTGAGMLLSVPTFSDGTVFMRDVIFKQQAAESYIWENFVEEINIANCDFSNINPKFFGCFLRDVGSKFSTLNVCTYDPDVGLPINNCRLNASGSKINVLYLKSQTGSIVHAILNSIDVKDMTNFFVEGDDITVWKSANVPNPTITSGSPTLNNIDKATSVMADYAVPTNYTPNNDTVTGHLQGIDTEIGVLKGANTNYINTNGVVLNSSNFSETILVDTFALGTDISITAPDPNGITDQLITFINSPTSTKNVIVTTPTGTFGRFGSTITLYPGDALELQTLSAAGFQILTWAGSNGITGWVAKNLTTANILAMGTANIQVLPAPGANRMYQFLGGTAKIYGTGQPGFGAGGMVQLRLGTIFVANFGNGSFFAQTSDAILPGVSNANNSTPQAFANVVNQPMNLATSNGVNFTGGGTGTADFFIKYAILDVTAL